MQRTRALAQGACQRDSAVLYRRSERSGIPYLAQGQLGEIVLSCHLLLSGLQIGLEPETFYRQARRTGRQRGLLTLSRAELARFRTRVSLVGLGEASLQHVSDRELDASSSFSDSNRQVLQGEEPYCDTRDTARWSHFDPEHELKIIGLWGRQSGTEASSLLLWISHGRLNSGGGRQSWRVSAAALVSIIKSFPVTVRPCSLPVPVLTVGSVRCSPDLSLAICFT